MHQPIHAIGAKRGMTPERVIGLGFVGLLHVVAVSAIVLGLRQHFAPPVSPGPIIVDTTPDKPPPQTPPKMPVVDVKDPRIFVQRPVVDIAPDRQQTVIDATTKEPPQRQPDRVASIPDTATTGIMGTHSSPPYPMLERRLGHEGMVTLQLAVSVDGAVTGAEVVKSSGYPGLDEAAVSWVIAHWRYRPATRGGVAMPSQTRAAISFNLRTTG